MRAAAIDRTGPASVLTIHELPVPRVGPRDVLIAVDTAGIGSWEPSMRAGEWGTGDAPFPLVLGSDGSGIVVARGAQVRRLRPGDEVYSFSFDNSKGGFYAEYAVVPASRVSRIPRGLDVPHAGAVPSVGLTAIQGIDALGIEPGDRVAVVGASGNVGMFAVQFAKIQRARVLAIASGRDGVAFVRRLGADEAVDGRRRGMTDAILRFAPDGLDAVLGLVGGHVLTACLDALRRNGRFAYPNGIEPVPARRRGIETITYDARTGQRELARLDRAIERGPFVVPIAQEFPLEQAAQAHRRVEKGHLLGRVVLRVGSH